MSRVAFAISGRLIYLASLVIVVAVSFCIEKQWTAPEMSVHCHGAASTVTVKSNS